MNIAQIVIFVILALLILFGAHYFLYFSIVHLFSVSSRYSKNILLLVISFLTVSFILALILAQRFENIFTRIYYFISGFWLGFALNLIMAAAIIWLIIGVARIANTNPDRAILATILFILAFGYSIYGVWNAFNPKVKNIYVNIPGLPEFWKNKKIVQLSDLHLGIIHQQDFLKNIIEQVNAVHPEMVVITGDLFDGMDGDLDSLIGPLNDIKTEKGTFFITGNHETYLGVEKVFSVLQKTDVKILRDQVVDIDGLKMIGINYPDRVENKNVIEVLQSLKNDFVGKPNILLYHSPVYINQFKDNGINLQLSGHAHKGQIFPIEYISRFIYEKYYYGLHQMGDYTLYTTSGAGTWGPAMRTGNTPEIVVVNLK